MAKQDDKGAGKGPGADVKFLLPAERGKAAEWYAKNLGWRVFPLHSVVAGACSCSKGAECGQPGKHPRISIPSGEGVVHPATTDIKIIGSWWKKWPNANIGLWLDGADIVVLDIDKSDKKDGFKGLAEIMAFEGQDLFPATLTCLTPSGGKHHYFKMASGVPNKANSLGPGLDTWHTAHYVILPPSTHMKGVYQWGPGTNAVTDYPEWLKPKRTEAGGSRTSTQAGKVGRPAKERIDPSDPDDVERLVHALKFVDATDREVWVQVGFALARAFDWSDSGLAIYDTWAKTAHNYDPKKTAEQYIKQSRIVVGVPITCASIFEWARKDVRYKAWVKVDSRPYEIREYPADHPATLGAIAGVIEHYPIYQRGPELVEIVPVQQDVQEDGLYYPKGTYLLRRVQPDQLASRILPMKARWLRKYKDGWTASAVSTPLCATFLSIGNWPSALNLRAFVQHPTLRDDGSLLMKHGYDKASGLFVTDEIPVVVKDKPDRKDAMKALQVLMDPFSQYKWLDGGVSRAALMAAVFTVGLRHLFTSGVPLFAIDAPKAGSGKTKIVKAITNLWFGRPAATTQFSRDPEEMKKHLGAALLSGERVILFDNVPPELRVNDPTLNSLLTFGRAKFRKLGESEEFEVDSTATFFMTGNRLNIVGDMIRRSIRMRIDPEGLNPTLRTFKHDPLEDYVLEQRVRLLSAALTCARAFFVAGKPKGKGVQPMASFEQWSPVVRNMLLWLGLDDVQETVLQGLEADDENADITHLFQQLHALKELQPPGCSSAMLLPLVENNTALREAMLPFLNEKQYAISHPRVVTTVLSRVANQTIGGAQLRKFGSHWIIDSVE